MFRRSDCSRKLLKLSPSSSTLSAAWRIWGVTLRDGIVAVFIRLTKIMRCNCNTWCAIDPSHVNYDKLLDRGASRRRNRAYARPPAQTRTCGFPASASSVVLAFATGPSCIYRMASLPLRDPWLGDFQPLAGRFEAGPRVTAALAASPV